MEKHFEILRKTRNFLLSIINELSPAQLNQVPEGFNNNVAWNFGHVIAAQQGVCYKRAGLPMVIEEELFTRFKPESKPEGIVGENEIESLKSLLLSTIDDLEADYKAGKFNGYKPWTTRYGVQIDTIEDAISFLSFHDGLHVGYVMALRRALKN
ncbi:MAG: DinB family protein [Chitinophagaceae bacterium]|nr:MAG: DinB family protein [Chitinophagaceae bacterium]